MKKVSIAIVILLSLVIFIFLQCNDSENKSNDKVIQNDTAVAANSNGGFESQVKWGEHLVTIGGCNDCHTPKKMTPMGPELDSSLALSGHPAKMPPPDVDRKLMEGKGLVVTQTLTAWVGPWGISYAANLTSDSSGIGDWTEDRFILCLREGKWEGLAGSRQLLPPMPWFTYKFMSDDELKAIFAYLKSTKPIQNNVPVPVPPALARK
ncbi:MAG: diheme cytochrome c-553 [Ginsengibacter sp.]